MSVAEGTLLGPCGSQTRLKRLFPALHKCRAKLVTALSILLRNKQSSIREPSCDPSGRRAIRHGELCSAGAWSLLPNESAAR